MSDRADAPGGEDVTAEFDNPLGGTVTVRVTEKPHTVTVTGHRIPQVVIRNTAAPFKGHYPSITTRNAEQLELDVNGKPATLDPSPGYLRRATYQVRASSYDGHDYLLRPTRWRTARLERDGQVIARLRRKRVLPGQPSFTVAWVGQPEPADVAMAHALAGAFGVGEVGAIVRSFAVLAGLLGGGCLLPGTLLLATVASVTLLALV